MLDEEGAVSLGIGDPLQGCPLYAKVSIQRVGESYEPARSVGDCRGCPGREDEAEGREKRAGKQGETRNVKRSSQLAERTEPNE